MTVVPVYEAELGTLHNLSTESINSDYTGTGYIAGWNANGEWVDFSVNVPSAGNYTLTFRYAAAAGNASRYLYINGAGVVNNLSFPNGGSWTNYLTLRATATLHAGSNTISLIYDSSKGSTNYLNLDNLALSQ